MPIIYFFYALCVATSTFSTSKFTLMLDPAGDAKHTGRTVHNTFERGVTLQCAEYIQKKIHTACPHVRVVLTRLPTENIQTLQNANFANRLDVDLYISIHIYEEKASTPCMYMYRFSYHPMLTPTLSKDSLHTYDMAHLICNSTTQKWCQQFARYFNEHASFYTFLGPYAMPCAPLIGIQKPAYALDIGISTVDDWKRYSDIMVDALLMIITEENRT